MSRPVPLIRWLVAGLLATGMAAGIVTPALGHAELSTSSPTPNASLLEAPDEVTLTFTEAIDPANASVELLDSQRRAISGLGGVRVSGDGRSASVAVPDLGPEVYTVSYQVVSTVDGHATAGSFAFVVDPTGAAPPPTSSEEASSPSVDGLTVAARWLALAAMLVAFGSISIWWLAGRPVLDRATPGVAVGPPWVLITAAGVSAAVGIAAYLGLAARPLEGAGAGGLPFDVAAPFGSSAFAVAMRLAFGAAVLTAVTGVVALVSARRPGTLAAVAGALLVVGLAGMSMASHASSLGGPAFAAIDWLHLVAAAVWLGALPAAAVLARRAPAGRREALRGILRRHGRVALLAAPVVALTGIANSPLVLGSERDLVASDYGNLLVAKALLLSVAVGIGAANHLALRGRGRAATGGLLAAELGVAVLAVAAAATMVTIQPASQRQPELVAPLIGPAHLFGQAGPSAVHASVTLPTPGPQSYRVTVSDHETGAPRDDVQKVFLTFEPPPDADLEPQRVEMEPDAIPGLYVAAGTYTPFVGEWALEVTVRRRGATDEAVRFELPIGEPPVSELGPPPSTGIGVPAPLGAAWGVLPPGPLGWLPALGALTVLVLLGRARPSGLRSSLRGAAVTVLVVAIAAAGSRSLVAASNEPTDEQIARHADLPPGSAARGEDLYRANCASCHGASGDGEGVTTTLPEPRPLDAVVPGTSDARLSYRIGYGVAGTPMPAFTGVLTPDERADLVAYLRERWGGG